METIKIKKEKKKISKRIVIGIASILLAVLIAFVVAPFITQLSEEKVTIVRASKNITEGSIVLESDIDLVDVSKYNLPKNVIMDKNKVIGKYAKSDIYLNDNITNEKLRDKSENEENILENLDSKHKAISVSISSFSAGLAGKLKAGDIVSIMVYSSKDDETYIPPELTYVKVIAAISASGVDTASDDTVQPVSLILLVNNTQAEKLVYLEKTATLHFMLQYRGKADVASQYLETQEEYLNKLVENNG